LAKQNKKDIAQKETGKNHDDQKDEVNVDEQKKKSEKKMPLKPNQGLKASEEEEVGGANTANDDESSAEISVAAATMPPLPVPPPPPPTVAVQTDPPPPPEAMEEPSKLASPERETRETQVGVLSDVT